MAKAKSSNPRPRKSDKIYVEPATPSNVTSISTRAIDVQEAIRTRAYELFLQRGSGHGRDFEDWLRAEAEVLERFGARSIA